MTDSCQPTDTRGFVENWQGGKSLAECNLHMLNSEDTCDVIFRVGGEGQVIKAHRYVLISRSCVFYSMFTGPLAETSEVKIPDVDVKDFKAFLTYLYTNDIPLEADNVTALLYTAKKYAVTGLEDLCRQFLSDSLTPENACTILQAAHHFDEEELYKKALRKVLERGNSTLVSAGFLELSPEHVGRISKADELNVDEEVLFESVNMWAESECKRKGLEISPETKRTVLGDVLSSIRFTLMKLTFISKQVKESGLLSSSERMAIVDSIVCPESQNLPLRGLVSVSRFSDSSDSHNYNGAADAISFTCNKNLQLHGMKLYGSGNPASIYTVTSYFGISHYNVPRLHAAMSRTSVAHNSLSVVQEETVYNAEGETFDVLFSHPQIVNAGQWYTLMVRIHGAASLAGGNGNTHVTCERGVSFSFSDSPLSQNGTSCVNGQIPSLIYRLPE